MDGTHFEGRLLRELEARRKTNPRYSLRAFAVLLGADHSTLSQVLRGKRPISVSNLRRWARKLALSSEEVAAYITAEHVPLDQTRDRQEGLRHWSADLAREETLITEAIERGAHFHLVMNSSFLYRDKRSIKTLQSSKRLVIRLTASGRRARADTISVLDGTSQTAHYKLLSGKEIPGLTPLSGAVTQELSLVGDLIFVLIGTVRGLRPRTQSADSGAVKELRLVPSLPSEFQRISAGVYAFKRIVPVEDLLAQIGRDLEVERALSQVDRQALAKAYDSLLDDAVTEVIVPTGEAGSPSDTILGKIVNSLSARAREYATAVTELQRSPDDQRILNEVLRLAYNFSTDVLPLISLFTSICDLKPLVFWCTIGKQWELYRAFASLPWSALGRKEKLEEYQSIVSEARNSAFHHVLPFEATIEVDLSNLDVRAEKIRLFSQFGQKHGRGVLPKDQQLADVFAEFSRARQRPISNLFWQANLKVVAAACELAKAVLESLVLIHEAKRLSLSSA